MKKQTLALVLVLLLMAPAIHINTVAAPSQQPIPNSPDGSPKDVLIIDDLTKRAYFGWYRTSQMNMTGWDLLNRTIQWATSYIQPNSTTIVLFTYAGTLHPTNDADGKAVYDNLVSWGYSSTNITVHLQSDIGTLNSSYYTTFHLVIYALTFDRDASLVIDSEIPFITFCAGQTDEMGIGTGLTTMHEWRDTFYVVSSRYYPTYLYPIGPLAFESSMWVDGAEAAGSGVVLITAEVTSVATHVEMAYSQTVDVQEYGNATISLTIGIPDSPLADLYREVFFADVSALVPGVEYDIPEGKTVTGTLELKEGVLDISMVGDINGDGKVDIMDIAFIAIRFGTLFSDENYDLQADLSGPDELIPDGKIDIRDIATAARNFGMTHENTGHLSVTGYYNGTAIACSDLYYIGPQASSPINVSECGQIWHHIRPGVYTIFGKYGETSNSTVAVVTQQETVYAQLDFGGENRPPLIEFAEPVRDPFHMGIVMDQAINLGFDMAIIDSSIVPFSDNNKTTITIDGYSPYFAMPTGDDIWRIYVGPQNDNATDMAIDSVFTKIEMLKLMLLSLPGDQYYLSNWLIRINLPPDHIISTIDPPAPLNWTVDFGGGTYMQARITALDANGVTLEETTVITEQPITASIGYLNSTFASYRKFSINYYSPLTASQNNKPSTPDLTIYEIEEDWSKSWARTIQLGILTERWSSGPLEAQVVVTPSITLEFYLGWRFSWFRLRWFKTYVRVSPDVKVHAFVLSTVPATGKRMWRTWTRTFAEWSYPYTFTVYGIPVEATLRLTITGGVTVEASANMYVITYARVYSWFKAGVQWQRGSGWSGIWEHGYGAEKLFAIAGSASITVTPKATCRLALLLYDVVGPFVEAMLYAPFAFTYVVSHANTYSIRVKLKIIAGITFGGWLKEILGLSDKDMELADWTLASWSGTW